jgi:hypothetical protein
MLHLLVLIVAIGYPYLDVNQVTPAAESNSDSIGVSGVDIFASTAIRSTHWEIKQAANGKEEYSSQTKTTYKIEPSILREYKLKANVYGYDLGLIYLKNGARQMLGKTAYAGVERLQAYAGFDGVFESGRLALEYRNETSGGLAYINDPSSPETTPIPFTNHYEQLSILKENNAGVYWGASFSKNNLPMNISFSNKELETTLFDPDVSIYKTAVVLGGSSTPKSLNTNRHFNSLYTSARVGVGAFSYKLSDSVKNDIRQVLGEETGYTEGIALDANLEIGWSYHKRFQGLSDLGFAAQIGLSAEIDFYDSMSGSVRDPSGDIKASFNRTDIRYGPIARFIAVF